MNKINLFFVFFLASSIMYASEIIQFNPIDMLHKDHCVHVQKYLNYQDLKSVILTNQKLYAFFKQYVDERIQKDLPECILRDSYLQYIIESRIHNGCAFISTDNKVFNDALVPFFKKGFQTLYQHTLFLQKFIKNIRNKNHDEQDITNKRFKKYSEIFFNNKNIFNCKLLLENDGKKSIIVKETKNNTILNIPNISEPEIQEQLSSYTFNINKNLRLEFDTLENQNINNILEIVNMIFPLKKLILLDISLCSNYAKISDLNYNLFLNNKIKIIAKENVLRKIIYSHLKAPVGTDFTYLKKIQSLYTDDAGIIPAYYKLGLGVMSNHCATPYRFNSAAIKNILKRLKPKNNSGRFIFSSIKYDILYALLDNMIVATERNHNPKENFCPYFMQSIEPLCFANNLLLLKQSNNPIVQRTKDAGLGFFLDWIEKAIENHVQKYGFNLQRKIAAYIIKACFKDQVK